MDKAIIDNLNNERVATLKEFKSLSEKIFENINLDPEYKTAVIEVNNIKEAVKLLKESLPRQLFQEDVKAINKEIDKIFGPDLI